MSVFSLVQAQGIQTVPGSYSLPDVAAVDTNFFVGAYVDNDPKKAAALNALESHGSVLLVPSKVIDELVFRVQKVGEKRYMDANGISIHRKVGNIVADAALDHIRHNIAQSAAGLIDLLETAPYVIGDTSTADIRLAISLFQRFGLINGDAQIISTALRNGVCDIVSDDGDYSRVPNINQWTTRAALVNTAPTDLPTLFDRTHWSDMAPPDYFTSADTTTD